MRRRELLAILGAATVELQNVSVAQNRDQVRRIGVLSGIAPNDPDVTLRVQAFREGLQKHGWTEGRDIRVDYRWSAGDVTRMQTFAEELVGMQPEVIVAQSTPTVIALLRTTRTIPVVFVNVADPIGSGLVTTLARPEANVTGFTNFEPGMGQKWLELLKEVAPQTERVCLIFNPSTTPSRGAPFLRVIQAAAPVIGVTLVVSPVANTDEIDRAITAFAREPNGSLLPLPDTFMSTYREQIIALTARHRLPAIYPFRYFATSGGLMSYGVETVEIYRRSASYVDRILRGAKPSDLPVQAPNKFEFVINLKTATALGITAAPLLLARADEIIE